jgi:RNA-directed DNA polymerase
MQLLIKPSARSMGTLSAYVRETTRGSVALMQTDLIALLNPKVRGWAQYHRYVVAKTIYRKVDTHFWQAVGHWHDSEMLVNRCGGFERNSSEHGATDTGYLRHEPEVEMTNRIVRHVGFKSDATAFDPAWKSYFVKRQAMRMLERLQDRGFPEQLWQQQ